MGNKTAILSDDFIANINEFASEYIHKKDINDISLLSLDVLTKLPNFYCSSIYLIEDETYTFNFVAGKPANFNFEAQFEYLLVNESIGNALSGCEIVSYPCKSPGYTDYIVPILGYDGVLALVIAKFKNDSNSVDRD